MAFAGLLRRCRVTGFRAFYAVKAVLKEVVASLIHEENPTGTSSSSTAVPWSAPAAESGKGIPAGWLYNLEKGGSLDHRRDTPRSDG